MIETKVWDVFVRFAHWATAAGFFIAYLTEDDVITVHVWAGYLVGGLVLLRILWGVVGPRHARFSDFVTGPLTALRYLRNLMLGRARRYIGHSPAGAAMVIALWVFLAATVTTGLIVYAEEEGGGPLAPLYMQASDAAGNDERKSKRKSAFEEIHEASANITLVLVILHVLGVLLASFVHQENLTRSMITGRKHLE